MQEPRRMNAPLARYLTCFATPAAVDVAALVLEPTPAEPTTTMTVAALDRRLQAARDEAGAAAEARHAQALAALEAGHATALAEAAAAARTERADAEAEALLAQVDSTMGALRETLAEAIAKVLRPLVADAVRARALDALGAAIACLVADPAHPAITLRVPEHLVAALRARGMPAGVELAAADIAEAVVVADGTRIETRLGAALAELAADPATGPATSPATSPATTED